MLKITFFIFFISYFFVISSGLLTEHEEDRLRAVEDSVAIHTGQLETLNSIETTLLHTRSQLTDLENGVTQLENLLGGNTVEDIDTRLTTLEGSVSTLQTSTSTRLNTLENKVNNPTTGLDSKASASTVTALDSVVNNPSTGLATKASQSSVDTLTNTINNPTTGLDQRALKSETYTKTEVDTSLATKASQSSVDTLTSRTQAVEDAINTPVTGLNARVDGLTTQITDMETVVAGFPDNYVTKVSASNTYAKKTDVYLKTQVYNRTEVDSTFTTQATTANLTNRVAAVESRDHACIRRTLVPGSDLYTAINTIIVTVYGSTGFERQYLATGGLYVQTSIFGLPPNITFIVSSVSRTNLTAYRVWGLLDCVPPRAGYYDLLSTDSVTTTAMLCIQNVVARFCGNGC